MYERKATMTIIRTQGNAPDVYINGIVMAEIKRQREMYERNERVLTRENATLHEQVKRLDARLQDEQKHRLRKLLYRFCEELNIILMYPVLWSMELKEWWQRNVLGMDDYDMGREFPRGGR